MDCVDRRRLAYLFMVVLVVTASMPATARGADLANAKIALHLVPGVPGPDACGVIPESRCSDSPRYGVFNAEGELDRDYQLYVIAVDINTSAGLASASFVIEYDEGVVVDSWRSCADNPTYSPDWPAPGSHVGVSFTTCGEPSRRRRTPRGRGGRTGVFHVRAHSAGRLAIGALDTSTRTAEARSCEGTTNTLHWYLDAPLGYPGNIALGEVGFEQQAFSTCDFPGIVDDGCQLGWVDYTYRCCLPAGGCVGGMSQASPRACEYAEGSAQVRCAMSC